MNSTRWGMCDTMALPFLHLKSILRQKKRVMENSNIPPCKIIDLIFQKSSKKETKIL